jgi:hypothetical protein
MTWNLFQRRLGGVDIMKLKCVCDYNVVIGGTDLKNQKLQLDLLERKTGMKWFLKLFRRILNVTVYNVYITYST